jgi:TIR domain/WD domain, G-beta repeat
MVVASGEVRYNEARRWREETAQEARDAFMSVSIFFCYAHEDEELLNKLKRHLWPLQRQGLIAVWHDRDISAGTEWEQEISQHLNAAQIILLLVSPDFMYSDYCYGVEMKRAIERHQRGEARVIPVILRSVYWQGILGHLQALPIDAKPVRSWADVDEALYNVTEGIRTVVEHISVKLVAQAVETQQAQVSASSAERPMHIQAAVERTRPIMDEPKPASSTPAKGLEAEPTLSTVPVPKHAPTTPLLPSLRPEAVSLLRTLTGHTNNVWSVAFSTDGHTLASGGDDHTIKLWNLATGKEVFILTKHTDSVYSVGLSPDGQTLASGSADNKIKIWGHA